MDGLEYCVRQIVEQWRGEVGGADEMAIAVEEALCDLADCIEDGIEEVEARRLRVRAMRSDIARWYEEG